MGLSYKNILNGEQLSGSLGSGDFSLTDSFKKKATNSARYIKGYAQDSAIEALANSLNINKGLFKQAFGIEDKKLDDYDPYHTSDSKNETGWFSAGGGQIDGEAIQSEYDEDTNTFKRGLYSQFGFRGNDFWYEDPFMPTFELYFNEESPFFSTTNTSNSLMYFINKYSEIDPLGYGSRTKLWTEFRNVFFKIFEKDLKENSNRNFSNKAYYITKIKGLEKLNNKFINYYNGKDEADKITITLNEDVSMIAWYLSELYNNIIYSYKNQRHMFPENLIRFDMTIKINDIRNFTIPEKNNSNFDPQNEIKNTISPKSQIVYTLHDCNFNFEQSRNYEDEMTIGGYGSAVNNSPQTLSFDIYYKSVTRWSEFPLLYPSNNGNAMTQINPWSDDFYSNTKQEYYNDLDRINSAPPQKKGFTNQLLGKAAQTVANNSLNYMDSLEAKLRDVRGSTVNNLLTQFRSSTGLNKIEPDNVYNPNFNDRTSLKNFAKTVGSGLLTDLENATRNAANF
jgi:hypothetical protein